MSNGNTNRSTATTGGAILVALVTVGVLLPFANKAFHIDDTLFLAVARQIRAEPLFPYDFPYSWEYDANRHEMPMWEINQNPPLNSYFLAAITLVAGLSEIAHHAAYLVFSVGCALFMYRLATHFCGSPILATLAAVLSPAFLVSACSVMCDVPQLFFWLWAIDATVRAADRDSPRRLWIVGVAASLAAMTKYFGIALMPLLAVYWVARQRRLSWPMLWLALPIVPLTVWGMMGVEQAGIFHPLRAASFAAQVKKPLHDVISILPFLGGTAVWPLLLIPAGKWLPRWARLLFLTLFVGMFAFVWIEFTEYQRDIYVYSAMTLGGAFMIALAAASWRARPDADTLLLALWLFGTIVFSAFVNWTVNTRVVLPAIFPAAVLTVRWIESLPNPRIPRDLFRLALAPTAIVALVVAKADYDFANAPRTFVREQVAPLARPGAPLLFVGHWGLQHYLERLGAQYYDYVGNPPPVGTLLVHPVEETNPYGTVELIRSLLPLTPISFGLYDNNVGIHTMQNTAHAGFYASVFGPLPYNLSRDPYTARFAVSRVRAVPADDAAAAPAQ